MIRSGVRHSNYPDPHKNRIQVTRVKGSKLLRSGNVSPKLHRFPKRHEYRFLCDRLGFPVDKHLTAFDCVGELPSFCREEHTALCLCNKQKYPEISNSTKKHIQGLLRLQNRNIFIKKDILNEYLQRENLDPIFKRNIENYLNIASDYYAIPKNVLDIDLKPDVYCKGIAELCELSELEKAYHIRHSDGRELGSILKYGTSDQPSATKE